MQHSGKWNDVVPHASKTPQQVVPMPACSSVVIALPFVANTISIQSTSSDLPDSPTGMSMTKDQVIKSSVGFMYLALTLASTRHYLTMLSPVMANDLWWAGFNASRVQSYLIDEYNVPPLVIKAQTL
ncbi:hypothetical protein H257_12681 [Aphanomyces astaci]|uniref:Uncharacterized protein n=1 Tax=Aphanomyces astaci TaxID=112090 RepID=W4FYZ1_APHAT|nr:hypothetical protein H257_12681 [Aphanomyces astaci]ETV72206.1 hypothetical protein H257_12681 [Aphanomyces astaci]|eukprot:XP_009838274.1 hypothetical protein H257_12681 [Aphanomyces astaci]